jgi:aminoglycoside phosphotransferase (APT) family kinase protein
VTIDTGILADSLLTALRRDSGLAELGFASRPVPLGHGAWAEVVTFKLAGARGPLDGELVAKVTPSRDHGEREAVVQSAVVAQGYPAPPILLQGVGPGPADGCYLVMPRVDGEPPLSGIDLAGVLRAVPTLARLPNLLAELAVQLHRLDPQPLQRELTTRPGWPVDLDDLMSDMTLAADGVRDPTSAAAIRSVVDARPREESASVICHGDFHPLNLVLGPTGSASVIDWTGGRLAPPAFDVSFTALLLAHPPIAVGRALRGPIRAAGRWISHRFVASYRRRARAAGYDLPTDELTWFTRLHAARILLEVSARDPGDGHPWTLLRGPAWDLLRGPTRR